MRTLRAVFACWAGLGFPMSPALSDSLVPSVHRLSNGIVDLTIMDPNAPERYHQGARFSPVAFVLTATKGGKSYLFCPAEHHPDHDGAGLAMEFDILTRGGPPGFREAAIGEGYLKIGVGVLRKQEKHYRFENSQEVIERAATTLSLADNKAIFHQRCQGTKGYAYSLSATVRLEGHSIIINYTLTNTGSRAFTTENYAHNYFCFEDIPPGPGYELVFPYEITAPMVPPWHLVEKRVMVLSDGVAEPANCNVPYPSDYQGPNAIVLHHRKADMKITAITSVPGTRTFLHANSAFLSPEQFIKLDLPPGQGAEWTRTYQLGSK